jgi:hypothetical protein
MTTTPTTNPAAAHRTRNCVMTTTAIDLLDALRAHLNTFDVPAPWSVNVSMYSGGPNVSLQIVRREVPEIASALLAWADTLTDVTADAWRTPEGDSVHLSVTGHLPTGVLLRVYGYLPFTARGLGAELAPNTATTLPLHILRHLATPGEATF